MSRAAMVGTCGCMRLRREALCAMAQITSLWRQEDSPGAKANGKCRPAATDNPKSIVREHKECITKMGVAQRARRGSHPERAEPPPAKRDNPPFVRCDAE